MTQANFFFLVFLLVVTIVRVTLYYKPFSIPRIRGFQIRHYMVGIALMLLAILLQHVTLYGIGFGLLIEEVPLLITHGKSQHDNYKPKPALIFLGIILVVYIFRNAILFF
jgi:hypothetical protein